MRSFNISRGGRRGNVTIIVIAFLMIFLVMALTFAFYSIAESDQAKVYKDTANVDFGGAFDGGSPPDAEALFNSVASDIIYGPQDGLTGAFSSLRGHDVGRLAFGYNPADPTGAIQVFNGVGWVSPRTIHPILDVQGATPAIPYTDKMINFQWAPSLAAADPRMSLMYESDNTYARNPKTGTPAFNPATYRYYAKNANYTYPDVNNLFLAAIDPRSGKVMLASYDRPWLITDLASGAPVLPPNPTNPADQAITNVTPLEAASGVSQKLQFPSYAPVNANNPNPWTNTFGRLVMLRPRPVDNMIQVNANEWRSYFPYPKLNADLTYGDVENLPGKAIGVQYDSVWVDPDWPVRRHLGKNYKPLVALLITDLDGRVNVNTAGNFFPLPDPLQPPVPLRGNMPPQYSHRSNSGFGGWEVNLAKVMPSPSPVPNPDWIHNDAAYLSRPPLAWKGAGDPPPPPDWKIVPTALHNRFGFGPSPYMQFGNPERQYRAFPNEGFPPLNMPAPGSGAAFYGQVDYDANYPYPTTSVPTPPRYHDLATGHETNIVFGPGFVGPPGQPGTPPRPHPDSRYGNGIYLPGFYDERTNHPSMFNPYFVKPRRLSNSIAFDDRAFGPEEIRILNEKYNYGRYDGSDLAALAPNTLGSSTPYGINVLNPRFAVTPLSSDFDLAGSSPWLGAAGMSNFALNAGQPYPVGTPTAFGPSLGTAPAPGGGDHDAFYRALLTQLGPVDINRKLTDYRGRADQPYSATNYSMANAQQALQDRQALAKDIFDRLRLVTTGAGPTTPLPAAPPPGTPDPNYDALRWLAQLAVNIVDYIDNDDYMTPFNWNPNGTGPPGDAQGNGTPDANRGWVFGFERPRLVINEMYGRVENDPNDPELTMPTDPTMPKASTKYVAKWWVELHNPLTPANANELLLLSDGGAALLRNQTTGASVYQLVFAKKSAQTRLNQPPAAGPPGGQFNDNVLGSVNQADELYKLNFTQGGMVTVLNDKVGPNLLDANGQGYSSPQPPPGMGMGADPAFFLVGSEPELPDDTPMGTLKANWADANLKYDVPLFDVRNPAGAGNTAENERAPRLLLRRLANPHEPPGPMNPYVTVDYFRFDKLMMNDAVEIDQMGMKAMGQGTKTGPFGQKISWNSHFSYGKRQPFAAPDFQEPAAAGALDQYKQQPQPAPGAQESIRHTFSRHNGQGANWGAAGNTLEQPFQPLVHLDRVVINPIELLHVAAVKPYELTQLFKTPAAPNQKWAYTANWLDEGLAPNQSTFLFRALEVIRPSRYQESLPIGSRVQGKLNINTMYAQEFLNAVGDAQNPPFGANRFTQADINDAWLSLVMAPGGRTPGLNARTITSTDNPIWGLASAVAPPAPGSMGRDRTIAKQNALWKPNALESYQPAQAGTLQKFELMSKSFNQLTTRSNCFAVYATIGYFEVMNDGPYTETNRPILGQELGTAEGTVVRHRFFAIVDRTNLSIEQPIPGLAPKQGQTPVYLEFQPSVPLPDASNNFAVTPDPLLPTIPPPPNPPYVAPFDTAFVAVRIPAASAIPGVSVSGYYDGSLWTIRDGSPIDLDLGQRTERVIVRVTPVAGDPVPAGFDPVTKTATVFLHAVDPPAPALPTKRFLAQHYRGASMRLLLPGPDPNLPINAQPLSIPGHPGPQAGFQYRAPKYATVVRYAEQLK